MRTKDNKWTLERAAQLRTLHSKGHCPEVIADLMDLNKKQVLSKCWRMGLGFKPGTGPRRILPGRVLPDPIPWRERGLSPSESTRAIIAETAVKHDLTLEDILSDTSNYRRITWVRHEAMYEVYRQRPNVSYPAMGLIFRRDHTSCVHGVQSHCERIGRSYEDLKEERYRHPLLRAETFTAYGQAMGMAA